MTQSHAEYTRKFRERNPWLSHYYSALDRCTKPHIKSYHRYGGRGIKFNLDKKEIEMLYKRDKAHLLKEPSIDRIDSDGDYTYDNCRFIEKSENAHNPQIHKRMSEGMERAWQRRRLDNSDKRQGSKHYDVEWLKQQLNAGRAKQDIANECGITAIGAFVDRYINHPECKTWAEFYKVRKWFRKGKVKK
jgi:hypothetical protein